MKYRKIIGALSAACLLAMTLAACQDKGDAQGGAQEESESSTQEEDPASDSEAGDYPDGQDAQETEAIMIPDVTMEPREVPDTEALQFTKGLKIGWNLGNTFDATKEGGYVENDLAIEYAWVGVKTTEDMIESLKSAGFKTLRIPVSWHNHLTDEDFTISADWLARVKEVVDYAIERDLYVILNTHHDVDAAYYYPTYEYLDSSKKYITAIWSQLSAYFGDYDEHLIFESMNEPRLVGTDNEWWLDMGKDICKEAVDCINQLNQAFVDTVRSSGGNNATRYLMVPPYSAATENAANEAFLLPEDTVQGRLIVSVHAYKPYNFALQGPTESGSVNTFDISSSKSTREIDDALDLVYERFIKNGIPVVMGEFGARDKDKNLQARVDMSAYYIAAATARGIPCLWWDNNAFIGGGENFGLLNRQRNTWAYPEIVEALMKYAPQ